MKIYYRDTPLTLSIVMLINVKFTQKNPVCNELWSLFSTKNEQYPNDTNEQKLWNNAWSWKMTTSVYCKPTLSGIHTHSDNFSPSTYKIGKTHTLLCGCFLICTDWSKSSMVSLRISQINWSLSYFWPMFQFYTPWKHQVFWCFQGGLNWKQWPEMG